MDRTIRRATIAAAASIALVAGMVTPALADTLAGTPGSVLQRQGITTPEELASPAPPDLQYADPTSGLSLIDPPTASSGGSASLSYPIVLPKGRGLTPQLSIDYDSGNGGSWVGQGWDFGVGEVSVDTTFGVPKFCPRTTAPACGSFESESYRLNGDLLMPNAQTASPQPRISERHDWTRQVQTQFDRIERHGTKPSDYSWEVTDKDGNVSFYGMFPDEGGFSAAAGTRHSGPFQNDRARDPASILADDHHNELTWYLKAQRDVGVNMIRYEYETVHYRATTPSSGNRTQWEEVPESSCTAAVTCAKHVYLSKLFYTGAAEASGQDEDPAYEVDFIRGAQRANPTIDARGGFLDLARDRLTAIQVYSLKPTRTQALEYRLAYSTGRYSKDQLNSITQVGCAGPAGCDAATASAVHTFTYYDDTNGTTLAASNEWNTQDNSLGTGRLEGGASALGMSSTNAGDGHLYLGFNLLDPDKTGSFGGSITVDGSTTDSLVEFMDINGDGLPDKVFRKDSDKNNPIWYTPNTSRPSDAPDRKVTYGDPRVVDGLSALPTEHSAGFGGSIEAYLVVSASFGASGEWNWSDGYFNDVNGDGLPDFIKGGSIYFNHLTCTGSGDTKDCVPHFAQTDQATRVPLTTQPVSDPASVKAAAERHAVLRKLSPPIDTVKRWVAPFDGTVSIASTATLLPCLDADLVGGVCPDVKMRLTVQKEDTELDHHVVSAAGDTWSPALSTPVTKGQRLYFRVGADADSVGRTVSWDPTITYTSYSSGSALPPADANGLSQKVFNSADDFTLAGRPGGFVGLPMGGDVLFGAEIDKAVTSDDVRPTATLSPGSGASDVDETVQVTPVDSSGQPDLSRLKSYVKNNAGKFCVSDGGGTQYGCFDTEAEAKAQLQILTKKETGRFVIGAKAAVAAPVTDSKGLITAQDHVNIHFAVDSPIDVNALRWVQKPRLCYSDAAGNCDTKKPDLTAPVDTDIYPNSTGSDPLQPWHSSVSGEGRVRVKYSVGDLSKVTNPGKIVLTVKTAADGYVLKKEIDPKTDASPFDVTMSFTKDTDYWFDLSMRVPGLGENVSAASASVLPKGGTDPADTVSVPLTVNTVGRQGYFPLAYRGWGVAGYLANEDRGAKALVQGDFDIVSGGKPFADSDSACKAVTGGACKTSKADVDGMTFPGSYSNDPNADQTFDPNTVESRFSKAYGYVPEVGTDAAALITETWKGPITHLFATRVGLASALLGGALPADDGSNGLNPPQLEGSTGPVLGAMIGLGPASASFAFGWSRSFVDYMDMNGDGFPDKVTTDSVTYTNPRGGTGCKQTDGSFSACSISRSGAVNQDTTFAVGGGLSGSPVGVKGNARGVPNATQGAAASKGGGTSPDEYGAGIGAGVGVSAEFGSPNAADPSWDSGNVDPNTTKLPGDPVHNDSTLAIQQTLADVNGDSLPDLVKTTPKGVFVYFNLGYGFAENSVPWASGGFESSEAYGGSFEFGLGFSGPAKDFSGGVSHNAAINFPRYSWADVNGDGILDALHRDDSNGTVQIAYGTGTGLTSGADLGVDDSVPFRLAGQITVPIKDQIRQDQSVGYGAGADVTIGFGPLCLVACYLIVNPGVHFENSLSLSDVDLLDVNGDGFADSVRRVVADSSHPNQERLDVQLNTHGRTGLLKTVTNPFHGVTTLDYDRYGNTEDHPGSLYALSRVSVDDKRPGDGVNVTTTTMSYQGMGYDFLRRQDLGFARVESDELATNGDVLRSTVENYRNDNVFDSGLQVDSTVYDGPPSAGKRVQRSAFGWSVLDGDTGAALSLGSLTPDESLAVWAVPERVEESQQSFGPDGNTVIQSTSTHFTYDALGAPVAILDRGDPADPTDDLTATIRYSDCEISASDPDQTGKCTDQKADASKRPAFWNSSLCPTWVHTAAQYAVTDSSGAVVRYRDGAPALCDNDSVTELNELISGPVSGGTYATTRLNYDNWGSYNRIVYPAGTDGSHYAVHYVYDLVGHGNVADVTDYQLTDAEADAFIDADPDATPTAARTGLHTTSVYDGPSGKVASTTDANSATTAYAYDPMGRLASVTTPDHQKVTYSYDPGNAAYGYATAKHSDAFGAAGATIDTATFVDGTGRVTQQKRSAEFYNGPGGTAQGFVVSPAVSVDALGREDKQWFPQKQLGGSLTDYQPTPPDSAQHTVSVYDKRDRVTSVTAPGDRTTTTSYSATTDLGRRLSETIVTDPLQRATRTLTDVRGLVRASEDLAVGKPAVRTDYDYTAMGDLTKVVTGGVTQSESTYDLLGDRLSTDTPDGGLTTWTYDAAGQQKTSQSPEQFAASTQTTYRYAFQNLVSIDYKNALPTVTLGYGGYDGVTTDGNGAGRLVSVKDSARTQQLTYDVNGQQASETTAMNDDHWTRGNVTTSFVHDYLGRLGSVTYIDGEKVTNHYDAGGSLASITGAKACTDLGTLAAAVDATQTTISVNETPHASAPVLPFTITIGGEQMRVTDRVPASNGTFTYTVERGINSTPLIPTAAPHGAGSTLSTNVALTCAYRYLDRQEYDEFGDIAFRQLGNSNQTWSQRDPNTRALSRVVSTAPAQGTSIEGTLAASASASATTLTVTEAYAPPPVPFTAQIGSEKVTVTDRAETAVKGTFSYTVARGQGGTNGVAHPSGDLVSTDRVQQNLMYKYDTVGNLTSYVNDLPVDTSSLFGGKSSQTYDYDPYYRIKSASGSWDTAPSTQRDYSLKLSYDDTSGNLLTKEQKDWTLRTSCSKNCKTTPVDATTYSVSPSYQSPQLHQFSTVGADTYTYDRNGEVTSIRNPANLRQMAWDATGHMTMIIDRPNGTGGKPTYYTYDYQGNRATETKETGRTWFVNQWTTVRDGTLWKNIWAGDERLGTKFSETGKYEHKSYWFQKDLQGSTNVVSDETGSMFQHREYFPDGQIWADESSTVFRSPYMAQGNYFDEDHNLSDFGQRWFDPKSQAFLSADPAAYDDPTGDVTDPTAAWSFTFARSNPLVVGDPDGRVGKFINPTVVQRDALTKSLTIDGKPLTTTQISSINRQLALHRGLKGKLLFGALSNIEKAEKIKALTEKFSTKPVLEFTFDLGADSLKTTKLKNVKLESIKLGAGVGPRKKFATPKPKPAAQKNPQKSNGAGGNP